MQRLKAVETSLSDGWRLGEQQELIPPTRASLTGAGEGVCSTPGCSSSKAGCGGQEEDGLGAGWLQGSGQSWSDNTQKSSYSIQVSRKAEGSDRQLKL